MKINKLNKKGFTLIELLAVVVILAIVMGISGSSVINSMNRARRNSLLSAAQNAANTINEWYAEDQLAPADEQKLGVSFATSTQSDSTKDKWICIDSININNGGNNSSIPLSNALSLSGDDFNLTGATTGYTGTGKSYNDIASDAEQCSAFRFSTKTGGYEVLLIASKKGKFYVNADGADKNFAFSKASKSAQIISY